MKKYLIVLLINLSLFALYSLYIIFSGVTDKSVRIDFSDVQQVKPFPITGKLPKGLVWLNGSEQKPFASSKATKGGTYHSFLLTFPKTLRQVGPESNSGFRSYLDAQDMSLVNYHPKTKQFYPGLAEAWAIGKDKRTVYFKLDKDATWNNGVKVTADDYVFALKFFRSPSLLAPWYNDYFYRFFEEIIKIDKYTIGVRLRKEKPDLIHNCNFPALPYHFYGEMRTVKKSYPVTKAYQLLKQNKKENIKIEKNIKNFSKLKSLQRNKLRKVK